MCRAVSVGESLQRTELQHTRWDNQTESPIRSDGINIRGVFTVRWDDNSAVQEICAKTSSKDVKPFDVRDKRLEGTEAEQFKVCWISLLFG